jgi:hypothetical protein
MDKKPITFHVEFTGPVDSKGKRPFTMTWEDPEGCFRPEMDKDGKAVGYRRGQCFHASFEEHQARLQARGHLVVVD